MVAGFTCEVGVSLSEARPVGEGRGTQRGRSGIGILSCEDNVEELGRVGFRGQCPVHSHRTAQLGVNPLWFPS